MSIKKFALIVAALAATASTASADSYFEIGTNRDRGTILDLGLVRADADGIVSIYDYTNGVQGALLGSKTVFAGANPDVRVNVGNNNAYAVLAVLEVNGQAVTSKDFDLVK
ncbi:MAG: hypothetical protein KC448_02965 [Yoonia sp.]|nr:hypothetical protein [Yoonia sp.]